MPIRILLVGATGKQGGQTLSALSFNKDPEIEISFMTRNPDSLAAKSLIDKGAKAIKGDLLSRETIKTALQGVDRALLVTDNTRGEEDELNSAYNFLEVAKEVGLKHIVFSSVCGAHLENSVPHFRSKGKIELKLKETGIPYTILRPTGFMDNFPIESSLFRSFFIGFFYSSTGGKSCYFISTRDIGIIASKALLEPNNPVFLNQTIDLAEGKYDLDGMRRSIKCAQGYNPFIISYLPKILREMLPYDIKVMFKYFEYPGFPQVDIDKLRSIHPDLWSLEDYFRQNTKA